MDEETAALWDFFVAVQPQTAFEMSTRTDTPIHCLSLRDTWIHPSRPLIEILFESHAFVILCTVPPGEQ